MGTGAGRNAAHAVFALAAAAVVLSGCAGSSSAGGPADSRPPDSGTTPVRTVIDQSRSDPSAPAAFRNRAPLPMCPDVVLGLGEEAGPEGLECLQRGFEYGGAELAVARSTIEGDMVVTFYRVAEGAGALRIFHDATRDRFGSGAWEEAACPLPAGADSIAACVGP